MKRTFTSKGSIPAIALVAVMAAVGAIHPRTLARRMWRPVRSAVAVMAVAATVGLGLTVPAPSMAAGGSSASGTAPAGYWLCYSSALNKYRWFEYFTCSGKSIPYS